MSSHVAKAEKARRHGRELSFILPHNAVDNFAPLFSAIENEINTRASRLGISSYGVSMTTLEEVRNNTQNLMNLILSRSFILAYYRTTKRQCSYVVYLIFNEVRKQKINSFKSILPFSFSIPLIAVSVCNNLSDKNLILS